MSSKIPPEYNSKIDSFLFQKYNESTVSYADSFSKAFDCPNWNGMDQRFHMSLVISSLVYLSDSNSTASAPCTEPARKLCQDTCKFGLSSLSTLFENPLQCNQNALFSATTLRNSEIQLYTGLCASLPVANAGRGDCIRGLSQEIAQCGFASSASAALYCRSTGGKKDPCCKSLGKADTEWVDSLDAENAISPAVPISVPVNNNAGNGKIFNTPILIVSVVVCICIIGFIGAVYMVRFRNSYSGSIHSSKDSIKSISKPEPAVEKNVTSFTTSGKGPLPPLSVVTTVPASGSGAFSGRTPPIFSPRQHTPVTPPRKASMYNFGSPV